MTTSRALCQAFSCTPPTDAPARSESPARALDIALARFPGSTLTALSMPTSDRAWYRVRVHAPGEVPRMYGTTTVFVSAANGEILREYPARQASFTRSLYDTLYPLRTGELGGLAGRLLLLVSGVTLLVMGVYGIRLWLARRKPRQQPAWSLPPGARLGARELSFSAWSGA